MTRIILLLIIIFGIVFAYQLCLGNTEDSVLPLLANQQESVTSNSSINWQYYLLGVSEYNEGNVELAKIWFQRAWESLESGEEKATAKTKAFRDAPEQAPPDKPAKVQFPEGYKVDVYYRDGWYIQPKNSGFGEKSLPQGTAERSERVYSFLPGSTYKIRLEVEDEHSSAVHEINSRNHKGINFVMKFITALVMMSWVIAR